MRKVMIDNARELCMGEMKEICEESRIKLNPAVRYSLQSNGVAERTIGVLTSAVRAKLHDSNLWAEAFSAATYVHNRTPTKALGGRTPYEVLYGMKLDASHLRTFGTPCAIIEPNVLLKKCDDRAGCVCMLVISTVGAVGAIIGCGTRSDGWLSSPNTISFEDSLPPPTLNGLRQPQDNADESVIRLVPNHIMSHRRRKMRPRRLKHWRPRTQPNCLQHPEAYRRQHPSHG